MDADHHDDEDGTGSDDDASSAYSLRSFDARDDDLGGRDSSDGCYTVEWARRVLHTMDACGKPVLLHCQTGIAACIVTLIRAAQARGATAAQVVKWSRDLGHDPAPHDDLMGIVARLTTNSNASADASASTSTVAGAHAPGSS